MTAGVLAAARALKVIARAGVGVDNIDVKAATERGVIVLNSPEGNTVSAAELTMAMLLATARKVPQAHASTAAGRWERRRFVGAQLYGKTLGVLGLGKIGSEVARRCRAFEMHVVAYDPFATPEAAAQVGARLVSLAELYAVSDFVTVHVPLNDQTRGLIDARALAQMRRGVRLVNCSRGGVVDEHDLVDAVRSGHVAGAALDVFAGEPPPPDSALLHLDSVVVTPHLGASTEEAQVNVAIDVAEQVVDVLQGRPARSAVNMPTVTPEALAAAGPFLSLGERIGSLHCQLARDLDGKGRPIEEVIVTYRGDFGDVPTGTVTRAILAGMLRPVLSDPVNLVNAPVLAAQRGVRVSETHTSSVDEYNALLSVSAATPNGTRMICGTTFGRTSLRVVHIDGYEVNLEPAGAMLMTTHTDKPGMIGAVGTLLGARGVNIAGMNVGREKVGGRALMVLMLDDPLTPDLLVQIRAIPGMETARAIEL